MLIAGDAALDTSIKKYGTASFRFIGAGAVRHTTTIGHFDISPTNTTPYCIELWARFDNVGHSTTQVMVSRYGSLIGFRFWYFAQLAGGTEVRFASSNDGITMNVTVTTVGAALVNSTWYHLAVDKDSTGKIRIYVDGVMLASSTPADSTIAFQNNEPVSVGSTGPTGFGNPFYGNIDDVRISAVSRYGDVAGDAGFTPPTGQFPDAA